jgi:hypothetical protein
LGFGVVGLDGGDGVLRGVVALDVQDGLVGVPQAFVAWICDVSVSSSRPTEAAGYSGGAEGIVPLTCAVRGAGLVGCLPRRQLGLAPAIPPAVSTARLHLPRSADQGQDQ